MLKQKMTDWVIVGDWDNKIECDYIFLMVSESDTVYDGSKLPVEILPAKHNAKLLLQKYSQGNRFLFVQNT